MTHKEYKKWLKEENIDVRKLNMQVNDLLRMDFEIGCYDNHDGTWTFYTCGERGELHKEVGTEDEIFEKMLVFTRVRQKDRENDKVKDIKKQILRQTKQEYKSIVVQKLNNNQGKIIKYKDGVGKGFAIYEIRNGREIRKSNFFHEEAFIEYMLNALDIKRFV